MAVAAIPSAWLPDVRRAELRPLAHAFLSLLLLITGYSLFESARDAMLLARFPAHALGFVYIAVALAVVPAAAFTSRASLRWGPRRALVGSLAVAALGVALLSGAPPSTVTLVAVYVLGGAIGGSVIPIFWTLAGTIFTVEQERRLLGILGAAGVLGGVLGSSAAAWLLRFTRVESLLNLSVAIFIVAAAVVFAGREVLDPDQREESALAQLNPGSMPKDPFVRRIALLVAASTLAFVVIDFTFKWTVSKSVPKAEIPMLVARYYAILNVISLVVQLVLSGAVVRRLGIVATSMVTPFAFLATSVAAFVAGGALGPVLVLKGVDGALRNSVHRAAMELVYLPLPDSVRTRAKPFIDGALAKAVQAVAGIALFALGEAAHISGPLLMALTTAAVVLWTLSAWTMRQPYLALLRRAIGTTVVSNATTDPLDMESAEELVTYLAHDQPAVVVGAMYALGRRGRLRLVPALVLLHDDEQVLVYALGAFAQSSREDWTHLARRLLGDRRESVRMAAARALALHGNLGPKDLEPAASPRLRGYAALHLAMADEDKNLLEDPTLAGMLEAQDPGAEDALLGVLSAVADSPPTKALLPLLEDLSGRPFSSRAWIAELARAVASQKAVAAISPLIERLEVHEGRTAIATSLSSLGQPALAALETRLRDPATPRALRAQLPFAISRFGDRQAAATLLDVAENDRDGLVRYKAIRGLGQLVRDSRLRVDRQRLERLALKNLIEHFRLLGLSAPFHAALSVPTGAHDSPTEQLLVGLLKDKLRQSLERTFRILKVANPDEDIHGVHQTYVGGSGRERAVAAELLDALLQRSTHSELRQLLLLAADESHPVDIAARARPWTHHQVPATREQALGMLIEDEDPTVAALARLHAAASEGRTERVVVGESTDGQFIELAIGERAGDEARKTGSDA
jgi:AAA family ATP:ADP antiporter